MIVGSYLNYIKKDDKDVRVVGIETIIASIRRISKESYTIYIATKQDNWTNTIPKDMKPKLQETGIIKGKNVIMFTMKSTGNKYIDDEDIISEIYRNLKDKKFKEYIGIYQNETAEGVSEANKETYKIITFVEE